MKRFRASKRYAGALLELALERHCLDNVAADVKLIGDSISASRELRMFFETPLIDREKKRSALGEMFGGKVDGLTRQFLGLLVDKGRERLIPGITVEFMEMLDAHNGVVNADVRVPIALDGGSKSALQSKLEALTKMKVRMAYTTDKGLLGGFLAKIGDTVYDGSVRRQLEILKSQLTEEVSTRN